jgi:hypothetical protein
MSLSRTFIRVLLLGVALTAVDYAPADAQGRGRGQARAKPKKDGISFELTITATRDVLGEKGFEVVRVEEDGDIQIVYYRRGNRGRGRGGGPVERLVIRRTDGRVQVEDAPDDIRVSIEIKLGIRIG